MIRPSAPAGEGADRDPVDLTGTGHMRIARDGTWFHEGRPIRRKDLVRLFSTVLRREDDGTHWLQTPVERVRVEVDDAPFVAEELSVRGRGRDQVLAFRTNIDRWVEAGPEHPIRLAHVAETGEPRPYIQLDKGLEALIVRSVFYELADRAEHGNVNGEAMLGVWSHGRFFPLGPAQSA